jgi:hypothetical protein
MTMTMMTTTTTWISTPSDNIKAAFRKFSYDSLPLSSSVFLLLLLLLSPTPRQQQQHHHQPQPQQEPQHHRQNDGIAFGVTAFHSIHVLSVRYPPSYHQTIKTKRTTTTLTRTSSSTRLEAQVTQQDAQRGIDRVVQALRKDKTTQNELGNLVKVTNVLGYGTPQNDDILAVRFNAAFQKKNGFGRSSVPLPFGLGQSNESEGRGTMVGQVKASLNQKTGKVISCSVFRDLGYGRSYDLKC